MKRVAKKSLFLAVLAALTSAGALAAEPSHFDNFITRQGAQLMDGNQEFRFAGIHAPELHRIENDARGVCKADPRGWGQYFKWPTPEEQENWIKAIVQTGARAQRVYVLSVQQENDEACERETHILAPATPGGMPRLNEKAMVVYDNMIAEADKQGLRLILPFIDHWWWWGGREQLAAFYHEKPEDFYNTRSKTYQAYLDVIRQVITRTNTLTGRAYSEEKAIMAWETGNELEDTNAEFLKQTAAWIKKMAPHQLVVDGTYKKINDFSVNDPNVDIVSNHYYTNAGNNHPEQVKKDLEAIGGKKVYLVGEFGLLDSNALNSIMQSIVHTDVNGAKAAGGSSGVSVGTVTTAVSIGIKSTPATTATICRASRKGMPIRKRRSSTWFAKRPRRSRAGKNGPLPIPDAPKLRETTSPFAINWMGAAVGRSYDVERAESKDGPWQVVGHNISDGVQEWNPETMDLFRDDYTSLTLGKTYFYRVIAKNETGQSAPSNVISVTHTQKNKAPVITLEETATAAQHSGLSLNARWQDDNLPSRKVSEKWTSTGKKQAHFCDANKASTRAWFPTPGTYQLTFTADDGLLKSSKTLTVNVTEATAKVPADFCHFDSQLQGLEQSQKTVIKSADNELATGEDGFLGPFANDGDKVSWKIAAPWDGNYLLHLDFNAKWGGKKNSVQINGDKPIQIEFPQTDEHGQRMTIPVYLKQGENTISVGKYAGDWAISLSSPFR